MTSVKRISESSIRRLSIYLRLLEEYRANGRALVSSEDLARRSGTSAAQVRRDLSIFGSFGKRGMGYSAEDLAGRIRDILGLDRKWHIVIIGAGKIGLALAQYGGFRQRGFHVSAVYDNDPQKVGRRWDSQTVRDVARLEEDLRERPTDIAIIATPSEHAQAVADRLVAAGVRAILSFSPAPLQVPDEVALRIVNMAMELEALSFVLAQQ